MHGDTTNVVILALFNLGSGEIILLLAVALILLGAEKLPDIARGLGRGLHLWGKSLDEVASDAGRGLGGIYGKGAVQGITTENEVAELYSPAVLGEKGPFDPRKRIPQAVGLFRLLARLFAIAKTSVVLCLLPATAATLAVLLVHPLVQSAVPGRKTLILAADAMIAIAVTFCMILPLRAGRKRHSES